MYILLNKVPILLNLEKIVNGGTYGNLTSVIIRSLVVFGGMLETNIVNKIICFWANSVVVFQGLKTGVTFQLVCKHCPFVVGIYYMAHRCNLLVQTLSSLTLVTKIEGLLSYMYTYYIHFLKRHLERTKLAKEI
jgi:hypothetical protein